MTLKDHKKHSDIARPGYGNFGRNEWAIIGTTCNIIKDLADAIFKELSLSYKCGYADAKHSDEAEKKDSIGRLANGASIEYTQQQEYFQFNFKEKINRYKSRELFNDADFILVNGNHFEAKAQVIIIDENKKASLKKRLHQLTNVQLILLSENDNEVFDFIKEAIPNWKNLSVYKLSEQDKIIQFFKSKSEDTKPGLNGLILAGGKSTRLGYNKASIEWHNKEQQYYLADLLNDFCKNVFISCRSEQVKDIDEKYKTIEDSFTGLGSYGAILSAFREYPDNAWLIIACDLPLIDKDTLQFLINNRNTSSLATAFENLSTGLPEPLITIWEPKCYPVLLSFLARGYTCPRKVLINTDPFLIKPANPDVLINVNTTGDAEKAKSILQHMPQNN